MGGRKFHPQNFLCIRITRKWEALSSLVLSFSSLVLASTTLQLSIETYRDRDRLSSRVDHSARSARRERVRAKRRRIGVNCANVNCAAAAATRRNAVPRRRKCKRSPRTNPTNATLRRGGGSGAGRRMSIANGPRTDFITICDCFQRLAIDV